MQILIDILKNFKYKEGWKFSTWSSAGLSIQVATIDSNDQTKKQWIVHTFPVPDFDMMLMRVEDPKEEVLNWLLDCIFKVEMHEAMEFFEYNGKKVFFPEHDIDVGSPYTVNYRG